MAGLAPSGGPPLIPLPVPSARGSNNTPILKWVLSRPNTHLLPLHLLTSGGTPSAVVDRKAFAAPDVPVRPRFKANNVGNDTASGETRKRADGVCDGKRVPTVSTYFPSLPPHHPMHPLSQHSLIEQQPADAMPLPQAWLEEEEERAPLSPVGLQQLLQPEAADEEQLLLRPLHAARRDLAHDLRDDADVVDYEEDERALWRAYSPVLPPSPVTAGIVLGGAVKEERDVIWRGGTMMSDDVIIGESDVVMNDVIPNDDDDDRMTADIDVVGWDEEEEERLQQWRAYSPVLPPSPPLAALLTGAVKREAGVEEADDVIEREKTRSAPTARRAAARRNKRPSADRPEVIYCKQYLGLEYLRSQRCHRLVLTPKQLGVCSAIMARVSYLVPAEREVLAAAIGITQRQVHNVFTNRGGRATQRKASGTSTAEALQVVREELLNHGYASNDMDDSVEKE